MKTYKMTVRELKTKYEYTIYGDNDEVIDTRKSNRIYWAATVARIERDGKVSYRVNYHGKRSDAGDTGDARRYQNTGYDVGIAYI